jgi:hypothetical protein
MGYKQSPFPMVSGTSGHNSALKKIDWTAMQAKSAEKDARYGKMSAEDYKKEALRQSKAKKETGSWDAMGAYDHKGKKREVKTEAEVKPKVEDKVQPEVKKKSQFDIDKENIAQHKATVEGNKEEMADLKSRQKAARQQRRDEGMSLWKRWKARKEDRKVRKALKEENKAEEKATHEQVWGRK